MKTDYTYCNNVGTCIHRRGCKRWVGNYPENEVRKLYTEHGFLPEVDDEDCMLEDYEYDNVKHAYDMLDRFRYSDGTEF